MTLDTYTLADISDSDTGKAVNKESTSEVRQCNATQQQQQVAGTSTVIVVPTVRSDLHGPKRHQREYWPTEQDSLNEKLREQRGLLYSLERLLEIYLLVNDVSMNATLLLNVGLRSIATSLTGQ